MPKYIPIHTNTCSLIQYVPIRPLHIPDGGGPVRSTPERTARNRNASRAAARLPGSGQDAVKPPQDEELQFVQVNSPGHNRT